MTVMALLRFIVRQGDRMRPIEFPAEAVVALLRKQKIAAMPELLAALGTDSRRTVFRKLKELPGNVPFIVDFLEE